MKRLLVLVAGAMLTMTSIAAHPLGNFTTNVHLGLVVGEDELLVKLVVDMAEIPTFREQVGDGYEDQQCETLLADIDVSLNNLPLDLSVIGTALSFPPGEGGLDTLRLECNYRTALAAADGDLRIENRVYADRLGWAEIVMVGAESELPTSSESDVLTNYPSDAISEVRSGEASLTGERSETGLAPTIIERVGSGLSEGPWFVALLAALGLGTGHALAPGHGKTLMAAYLVGRRGGVPQAVILGLTVAIAHTIGVAVLGFITAFTTSQFQPASVYPWLSGLSAAIVTVIGLTMLYRALRGSRGGAESDHGHDHDDHDHVHDHDHPHGHSHEPTTVGWRSLATLGLAGGLVPSASAVVLLLGGISRGEPWWGVILVVAFGIGMAATLVGAGLIVLFTARFGLNLQVARRWRLGRYVPIIGGVVVTLIGAGLLWQAAVSA
ncbi:MAG: sulfite exporter TauE/SafE family protein [Acidimicrobiia bacterium]|nr:sulfite exporter TauE/SafE family protein [Acidimicrobiia bacterium]